MEKFGIAPEKAEYPDQSYLKMYEVSGQDAITEHSLLRYKKDKQQDEEIKNQVLNSANNFREDLENSSGIGAVDLILDGLENNNPQIQLIAANYIREAPKAELPNLILHGLENKNPQVQKSAFESIEKLPPEKITDFILLGLSHPNSQIQIIAAYNIYSSPEQDRERLIQKGLKSSNILVQITSLENIPFLPAKDRTKIFTKYLDLDIHLLRKIVHLIAYLPKEDRPEPEEKIAEIAEKGLESSDINTQIDVAALIYAVPREDASRLLDKILEITRQRLNSPDLEIQKKAIEFFRHIPDRDYPEFRNSLEYKIMLGLDSPDIKTKLAAFAMIDGLLLPQRQKMFNLAIEKGLGEELIRPPLYRNQNFNNKNFSRQQFEKTGSGTTLIGGRLKDKTIIRHIDPEAFLSWQKIYENHKLWEENGFDYVPIEPIISYKLNKKGLVDVHSGVLDLSFGEWRIKTSLFVKELGDEIDKIIQILEKQNIYHGHAHDNNFCLRFFRDKEGKVDFTKKPRLYLIDFDQAVSPMT